MSTSKQPHLLYTASICRRVSGGFLLATARLLCCTLLVLVAATSYGQLANSPWPDYGGGYANQHRSLYLGPSAMPQVLWEFDLAAIPTGVFNRGYHQPILLSDGTLVLNTADTSNDQTVAINPDGSLKWYTDDSDLGPWLAVDDTEHIYTLRRSYALTNTERLKSIDSEGNPEWSVALPSGGFTQNGPAVGPDGNVYAAVDFGSLAAITPMGVTDWSSASSGYYVNPAISDDGTIVIGGHGLKALSPDGAVLWEHPLRTTHGRFPSYLSPAIGDNGVIYAGQINYSNLVALTPDGQEIWTRTDLDGAPAIGANGEIFVVPESGVLHALSPTDGSTLWTYSTGKTDYYNSEGVTIDASGNVYVSNDQGFLMSLTPYGELRWSMDLAPDRSGFIGLSAPVIGPSGTLYVVGGNTGKVFALVVPEPSTGIMLLLGIAAYFFGRRVNA